MNTFKDVMKEAGVMFAGLMLLFASTMSYMLLAFVDRGFSFLLLSAFILTPIGITLGYYLLEKGARGNFKNKKKPMAVVINRGQS